ncbi:MAG TPA: MFS transporter [Candidatus Cottocaccamicrobium excrementipullorum]|nr:MFS transporter [Candidatus Cottocaccamicrobium excrementipullorum]
MMKGKQFIPILCFAVLMLGLGSNDSLRGIFAPVFQERYALSDSQLSLIVTISYVGNLLFLSLGGKLLDTFDRKKVTLWIMGIWMFALAINLFTDQYIFILISMFLALGASTLLNTTINILTPMVCAGYAGLMVNVFFFIQGLGTSGSQLLLGRYAFSYGGWKMINVVLFIIGVISVLLFLGVKIPGWKEIAEAQEKTSSKDSAKKAAVSASVSPKTSPGPAMFWLLAAMLGCYFIGEHGIMNWFLSYCISAFSMDSQRASLCLSIFWGGMTIGRLVFAPAVQKLGTINSIRLFGGIGTLLFSAGIVLGASGIFLVGISGFAISILYPTIILFFQELYPASVAATRTGAIISVATIADILFNLLFGVLCGSLGYRTSFLILPVCMICFYIIYLSLSRKAASSR